MNTPNLQLSKRRPSPLIDKARSSWRKAAASETFSNTSWLIGDKLTRMAIGLGVGLWTARYMGPGDFGAFNFACAFSAFFIPISNLGLDGIVIRDLVRHPEEANRILASAFWLKFWGGLAAFAISVAAIFLFERDVQTRQLVALVGISMVFQSLDTIDLWFQSRILSKYTVMAKLTAFVALALVRIALILYRMPLSAFALATSVEVALGCLLLLAFYRRTALDDAKWRFSFPIAKSILRDCWPLIFSSVMILIYMRVDQVMLKYLSTENELGKYSAAVRVAEMWYFIPMAIVSSVFPRVVAAMKESQQALKDRMQILYNVISGVGWLIALPVTFLGEPLIRLLYGREFEGAGAMLSLLIWSGLFVGLGVARSSYLTAMNLAKFHFFSVAMGCACNVALNFYLIPRYGGVGASIATLIAYWVATHPTCFCYPPTRMTGWMISRALFPIHLISQLKRL